MPGSAAGSLKEWLTIKEFEDSLEEEKITPEEAKAIARGEAEV